MYPCNIVKICNRVYAYAFHEDSLQVEATDTAFCVNPSNINVNSFPSTAQKLSSLDPCQAKTFNNV